MSQQVTLTVPDQLYAHIERTARATHQPVESVVLSALQASLPSLQGLSAELSQELTALESLADDALRAVILETMPAEQQRALSELLEFNQARELTAAETQRLAALQADADRLMLRKAQAAVLLRFRGLRVPTVTELRLSLPNAG